MKKKFNQTSEIIIIVAVFLLIVNATLGIVLTRQSCNAMRDLIEGRMLDISNTAASMLDGDVLRDLRAEDVDTPGYQAILKTLTYYQDNIDLKYIYCIRDMGNGNFTFSVDPTVEDPGEFGEPIVYTDALYAASLGQASVDDEPYTDSWGRFYSAYSPVYDSQRNVAGIVAVDFSADWYDRQVSGQIRTIIIITVLSLSFGLSIVLMIASRSRKRNRSLMDELNRLSDGIEVLAKEISDEVNPEEIELLHDTETESSSVDEVTVIGNKIRSLQTYMSLQINHVRSKAYRDGLTGLENRTAYNECIESLNRQIDNKSAEFSVAMFDVNDLKIINDQKGHDKGDEEIIKAADILKEAFPDERIFRIGGDEFVVIISHHGDMAEKLMKDCEALILNKSADHKQIMSSGYAEYDTISDRTYQYTFNRADQMMYEHKKIYHETYDDRRRASE